jgi:hypothetical protein
MLNGNGITLKSTGSTVDVSYSSELAIDENEMMVSQLLQTVKGMSLFETEPKKVKMTRKTHDSKLESQDMTREDAKQENNHGQYIHIWSHYKFNDENGDNDGSSGPQGYEPGVQTNRYNQTKSNQPALLKTEFENWIENQNFTIVNERDCKGLIGSANNVNLFNCFAKKIQLILDLSAG